MLDGAIATGCECGLWRRAIVEFAFEHGAPAIGVVGKSLSDHAWLTFVRRVPILELRGEKDRYPRCRELTHGSGVRIVIVCDRATYLRTFSLQRAAQCTPRRRRRSGCERRRLRSSRRPAKDERSNRWKRRIDGAGGCKRRTLCGTEGSPRMTCEEACSIFIHGYGCYGIGIMLPAMTFAGRKSSLAVVNVGSTRIDGCYASKGGTTRG